MYCVNCGREYSQHPDDIDHVYDWHFHIVVEDEEQGYTMIYCSKCFDDPKCKECIISVHITNESYDKHDDLLTMSIREIKRWLRVASRDISSEYDLLEFAEIFTIYEYVLFCEDDDCKELFWDMHGEFMFTEFIPELNMIAMNYWFEEHGQEEPLYIPLLIL